MENLCEAKGASFMPPTPEYQVLEHQLPVIINKTQMSGEHGASQCGLSSLLPMSCRGRAAAFARDLHSRLRTLGQAQDDSEAAWLQTQPTPAQRDLETFYDFELECESPSSPVDEHEIPFADTETEPPFLDAEAESKTEKPRNGFRFSTAFYSEHSPVKLQPAPRENGYKEKPLYSPITFEGCARQNSRDEIDCGSLPPAFDRLGLPSHLNTNQPDSDSEFESAKSEPSDVELSQCDKLERVEPIDLTEGIENLSVAEVEAIQEDESPSDEILNEEAHDLNGEVTEIITSEVPNDKELSPDLEIEPSLLTVEVKCEEHDDDDRPERVRRCSSLKTGKTPPGTPGHKKIVRFADVLGLDLADVKTFMDEIPVIPKSAYDDLTGCDVASSPPARPPPRFGALTLVPLFQLPRDVTDILQTRSVCLETARVCEGVHVTVCGSVRVRNLDFHKTVHIRYTMNRWKTFTDLQTTYVQGSCDGYSDRFQFVLYAPCITSGQRLEVAVRFQCKGQQFWDNNCGANYCFDCLALGGGPVVVGGAAAAPLHPAVDWHPSFY